MKIMFFLCCLFVMVTGITSCKKGEDIKGVGFGELQITAEFTGNASPLLIRIDGEVRDTLSPATMQQIILLKTGEHKIQLVNAQTEAVLSDTTISIQTSTVASFPKFLYNGSAALFDDMAARPETDSMLVRFIILSPELPDELDLTFTLYDFGSINIPLTEKKLYGVKKDRFSNFIQLPDPLTIVPDAGFILYAIEGYKAGTNEKVMDIASGTNSYIVENDFQFFLKNGVVSVGLGESYLPFPIFTHVAK